MPKMTTVKLTDAELTRLAAEKVMGWVQRETNYKYGPEMEWHEGDQRMRSVLDWCPLSPESGWSCAGQIAGKMRINGWHSESEAGCLSGARFYKRVGSMGIDLPQSFNLRPQDTPRSITISALLAIGAITEDQL